MRRSQCILLVGAVAVVAGGLWAQADDVLITPTRWGGAGSMYAAYNRAGGYMIDNSGLSGPPYTTSSTHGNDPYGTMWETQYSGVPAFGSTPPFWWEFDLQANYDGLKAWVWNYNESGGTDRGVKDVAIFTATSVTGAFVNVGTFTFAQAGGTSADPAQMLTLAVDNVRKIRLVVQSNWGGPDVGISEIKFAGTLSTAQTPDFPDVITPVDVRASSEYSAGRGAAVNTINNTPFHLHTWWFAAAHNGNVNNLPLYADWLANGVTDQWIAFDLGSNTNLAGALVWNQFEPELDRGVKNLDVYVSAVGLDGPWTTVGSTLTLAEQVLNLANEPPQIVPFAAQNVRAVKFQNLVSYGSTGLMGLAKVKFYAQPAATGFPSGTVILAR